MPLLYPMPLACAQSLSPAHVDCSHAHFSCLIKVKPLFLIYLSEGYRGPCRAVKTGLGSPGRQQTPATPPTLGSRLSPFTRLSTKIEVPSMNSRSSSCKKSEAEMESTSGDSFTAAHCLGLLALRAMALSCACGMQSNSVWGCTSHLRESPTRLEQ